MNKEDFNKTARLARLRLSEAESAEFAQQLEVVFAYFDQISRIDTKNSPPLVYPLEGLVPSPPLRKDKEAKSPDREALLSLAPERLGNEYKVPPVVE